MRKFLLAAVMAAGLFMLPMQAFAADNSQQIGFVQTENKIDVSVTSSIAAREEISSLQLSLKVVTSGGAQIRFSPDSSLPAQIVESRYHADTETLNIYVAGGKALFDKDAPTCRLGSVVVEAEEGAVTVSAVEGSLKYVTGTELVAQNKDVSYPAAVNLTFGNTPAMPDEGEEGSGSPGDGNTQEPGAGTENAPSGGSSGGDSQPGGSAGGNGSSGGAAGGSSAPGNTQGTVQTGAGTAKDPEDTETLGIDDRGLLDAIARAEGYAREDYTEESYELLREAVRKAKELLDTHGVTQEELDEARLLIENAIGMLKLKDEAPVVQPQEPQRESEDDREALEEETSEGLLEKLPLSWPVIAAVAAGILILIGVIAVISWRRSRWLDD